MELFRCIRKEINLSACGPGFFNIFSHKDQIKVINDMIKK